MFVKFKKLLVRKNRLGPICFACGYRITNKNIPSNRPLDIYINCTVCKRRKHILVFLPYFVIFLLVTFFFWSGSVSAQALSLSISVVGSIFLISSLDVLVLAGVIYDGSAHVKKELPKANRRQWVGIILVVMGFVLALPAPGHDVKFVLPDMHLDSISIWIFNILASAIVGLLVVLAYEYLVKPKIRNISFDRTDFNLAREGLYKLRFTVKGKRDPGYSEISIEWNDPSGRQQKVFAKWDDTPNPEDANQQFVPEMVPSTFRTLLRAGQSYEVPIICSDKGELSVFSGWWFGRKQGYGPSNQSKVDANTALTISIVGSGMNEQLTVFVKEIINP